MSFVGVLERKIGKCMKKLQSSEDYEARLASLEAKLEVYRRLLGDAADDLECGENLALARRIRAHLNHPDPDFTLRSVVGKAVESTVQKLQSEPNLMQETVPLGDVIRLINDVSGDLIGQPNAI